MTRALLFSIFALATLPASSHAQAVVFNKKEKFAVGAIGTFSSGSGQPVNGFGLGGGGQFEVVKVIDKTTMIVQRGVPDFPLLIVKGYSTKTAKDPDGAIVAINLPGKWKVSGKEKRGKTTYFVIEPVKDENKPGKLDRR